MNARQTPAAADAPAADAPAAADAAVRAPAIPGLEAVEAIRERVSVQRRLAAYLRSFLRRHAASLAIVVPLLGLAGAIHLVGSEDYPRYVDDPGTYLSQAWSLRYEGELSPYSYFYDHPPAGWLQMAAWAWLTDGFDRYDSVIAFGTECVLIARIASTAMIYALARRVGLSRYVAAFSGLLFALSPLSVVYGRWTFLDNLAMPWLLGSFVLALSPRRSIGAATAACTAFGMAALTKETFLIFLPAFAWMLARNLDRRNRAQVLTVAVFAGLLVAGMYPLLALYKGELFPGPGHNSLLGTARWQLAERASTGSLLDPDSPMRDLVRQWFQYDRLLLFGGVAAMPFALMRRELRPLVLALALGWLIMLRDGYVPFMHVITMLPFCALLIVAALDVIFAPLAGRAKRVQAPAAGRVAAMACAVVTATMIASWVPMLRQVTGPHETPPLKAATAWAARNIPRDKLIVVHDTIWPDLVHHYGFQPRPVIAHKLDTDPAVTRAVHRIDYLIVPDWYYGGDGGTLPTLVEARKHAVPVASFGSGDDAVKVYRVSAHWSPR